MVCDHTDVLPTQQRKLLRLQHIEASLHAPRSPMMLLSRPRRGAKRTAQRDADTYPNHSKICSLDFYRQISRPLNFSPCARRHQ
jgi:hypothetical protein